MDFNHRGIRRRFDIDPLPLNTQSLQCGAESNDDESCRLISSLLPPSFEPHAVGRIDSLSSSFVGEDEINDSGHDLGSDDDSSSTASMSSEIQRLTMVLQRGYHSFPGAAALEPVDNAQRRQWQTIDDIRLEKEKVLFLSPITDRPNSIVDVGTGLGSWARDVADEYPMAHVIGTDLAPIQPEWSPPNCFFILDNAEILPWHFKDDSIDFIHMRHLHWVKDWPSLVGQAYRCLAPGGWFEWADVEFSPSKHHSSWQTWETFQAEVYDRLQRSRTASNVRQMLEEIGFTEIEEREYTILEGEDWNSRCSMDLGGMITLLHPVCGLKEEQIYALASGMLKELMDSTCWVRVKAVHIFAQKRGIGAKVDDVIAN